MDTKHPITKSGKHVLMNLILKKITAKLHPIKHIIHKALLISIGVYKDIITVLSAKIDSGVMFSLQHYQELMMDRSLVY